MTDRRSPATAAAGPRLSGWVPEQSRAVAIVQRAIAVVVVAQLVIASIAGYRAWTQVWRLGLDVPARVLRGGETVRADVLSSGRVPTYVDLLLVQGTHAETLATARVPANRWSFYDPRPRAAALSATLGADVLARFAPGPATVRAVGRGTMQFLRVPPPKTREVAVTIAPPGR